MFRNKIRIISTISIKIRLIIGVITMSQEKNEILSKINNVLISYNLRNSIIKIELDSGEILIDIISNSNIKFGDSRELFRSLRIAQQATYTIQLI